MILRFRSVITLALVLCFWVGARINTSAQSTYNFSALDRLLQDSLSKIAGLGGGYSLILFKDGREIYNKSFSLPGRNFTPDSRVSIASASKWLATGVIMRLVDDAVWRLDDSAGKYLPSLTGAQARMTIRQLFSMTSGINEDGNGVEDDILRNTAITLDSAVRAILAEPLRTAPGASLLYGGRGMQVAGRCAEIASRLPFPTGHVWDTLFARSVIVPLGMRSTSYDTPLNRTDNPGIAGSIISTANDYAIYLQTLLNGGVWNGKRIFSQTILDEMKRDQTNGAPILYSPYAALAPFVPGVDSKTRYALGHWREIVDASTAEALESSSQGAFGFSPWIDWRRNLVGVFAVQSQLRTVEPTYLRMKALIRAAVDAATDVQQNTGNKAIRISPNPASETLHIENAETASELVLTNVLGQVVVQKTAVQMPAMLDVSSLPSGLYRLYVQTKQSISTQIVQVVR